MRLHDLSLVTRVTIGVLGIVVSGAATLMFAEGAHHRDVYLSEQHAHLEKALDAEELRLNQTIKTLRQDVLFLSNTPPVSGIVRAALNHGYDPRYGNTHKVWAERLQQIFSAFSKAHPDYYKIRFIGVADGGREIVHIINRGEKIETIPFDKLQTKGDADYFKATLGLHEGQVHLSKFNLNQAWGVIERPYRPTLRATTPVFTPSGKIFGMVMINIDVNNLLKPSVLSLPQNTQAYITNGDGQYLFHPDSQRAFAFELGSKDNIATDFPGLKMMLNPQAADYMAPQAIKTGTGSALIAARRIYFDPSDPAHFLFLMYSIPDTVVAQHIPMMPLKNIIGGFIIMLLVGGMALLVLRRTFAPLAYITVAADKIAAGEQDIRLPQAGGGETGSLTSALNAMLARLSQRDKLLRESEIRYRRLHESMMDAFVMVDMSGRLLDSNRIFREMLGYSTDELQRLTYIDLTPEKWHEFEARIIKEQIIPNGYSQVYEKECIRKDGTVFPVELKTFLLRDASNQPEAMWTIVRDIAERKLTEKALARSEERARLAISASHLALWDYDLGTGSVYLSEGWSQLLGGELQPTLTTIQELTELVPEEDQYMVRTAIMEAVKGHVSSSYQVKHRVRKLDGGYIWVLSEGHVIDRDRDGRALRMIGTNRDITQSKQLEEAKQEALDRLQKIASQVPGVVYQFRMRPDGSFSFPFASEALREIFRVSPEQVLEDASPVFAVVHPDDLAATLDSILVSARNQSPWRHEARIKFDDGTMRWLFGNALPQREADGSVLWHGFITDITERKAAEQEMRDLSMHLQAVREEEKTSIAREIHDDLGGTLTALKVDIYWLTDKLTANKGTEPLLEHVKSMSQLIDNAVCATRRVITNLRPTVLDDLGLRAALEWQCAQFHQRTGIEYGVNCLEDKGKLDKQYSIALFRIFQEALTNISRHSGATRVEVEFHHSDEEVVLSIIDNGRGMPEGHAISSSSYGIRGMRERVVQLNGKIKFDTPPGGGFSVTVILPLPANNKKEERT